MQTERWRVSTGNWTGIRHLPSDGGLDLSDPFGNGLPVPSMRAAAAVGTSAATHVDGELAG